MAQTDSKIPSWIKHVAEWWANDEISQDEFLRGIEYMINNNIILLDYVPCYTSTASSNGNVPNCCNECWPVMGGPSGRHSMHIH